MQHLINKIQISQFFFLLYIKCFRVMMNLLAVQPGSKLQSLLLIVGSQTYIPMV